MRLIDADALKKQYYPFPCDWSGERGNDSRNQRSPDNRRCACGAWGSGKGHNMKLIDTGRSICALQTRSFVPR